MGSFLIAMGAVWWVIGIYLAYAERRYWIAVSRKVDGSDVQYHTPWLEVVIFSIMKPVEMTYQSGRAYNYHILSCLIEWNEGTQQPEGEHK